MLTSTIPTRAKVKHIKEFYTGKTVKLIEMGTSDPAPLEKGDYGVVDHVDDAGQLNVSWQSGRTLRVSPLYGDKLEII